MVRSLKILLIISCLPLLGYSQVVGVELGLGTMSSKVDVKNGFGGFRKQNGLGLLSPLLYYQKKFPADLSLNLGVRYSRQKWSYTETMTVNNGDNSVDFDINNLVSSVGFNFGVQKGIVRLKDGSTFYTQLDAQLNFSKTGSGFYSDDFGSNTTFEVSSTYSASNFILLRPEIGIKTKMGDQLELLFFGAYNIGLNDIVNTEYTTFQSSNIRSNYSIQSKGSGFVFGVKLQVNKYNEEKEKERRQQLLAKREERKNKSADTTPLKDDIIPTINIATNEDGIPATLNDRPVETNTTVEVKKSEITVKLWDHNQVDGDTISLFVNGRMVLENYCLTKEPKKVDIKLEPGKNNYIILYAHNLGTRGKNTAAISFKDASGKEKIRQLESDLGRCDAINIKTKKD